MVRLPSLVRAEWQRGSQALGAAEVLRETGYLADAPSRAYYATLHAAKAALIESANHLLHHANSILGKQGLLALFADEVRRLINNEVIPIPIHRVTRFADLQGAVTNVALDCRHGVTRTDAHTTPVPSPSALPAAARPAAARAPPAAGSSRAATESGVPKSRLKCLYVSL